MVVFQTIILRDHLGLLQTREQFAVEQFVSQPAVQRFVKSVLPGRPRFEAQHARGLFAADKFVGIAYEEVVNAGTDGAKAVRLRTIGDFEHALASVAQTNVGAAVYASDDGTLTLTASGNSFVGIIIDVPAANTVIVRIDPAHSAL